MKSHAARRSLWLLNLPLGLCLCAVVAWYAFDVRPAVAAAPASDADSRQPPAAWLRIDQAFRRDLEAAQLGVIHPPVTEADLLSLLLDPTNERMTPRHFPFSGPRPSGLFPPPPPPEPTEKAPRLETLGQVIMAIPGDDDALLFFVHSGESRARFYKTGDRVRSGASARHEYLLGAGRMTRVGRVEIDYEAYAVGRDAVLLSGVLACDSQGSSSSNVIRVSRRPDAGTGPVSGIMPPRPGHGGLPAGPARAVVRMLRPRIKPDPTDPRRTFVELDDASADLLRSEAGAKLLGTMKMRSRTLPGGRQGLEILDAGEVPLERFSLKRGDTIVSLAGQPTPDREAVLRVARTISPETSLVMVGIERNGRELTFVVDLRDAKTRRRMGQAAARMGEAD